MKLQNHWTLTVRGENVYRIPEKPIQTRVPSTVYGTLLEQKMIPDPYIRDNELDATKLMENDFVYETSFVVESSMQRQERIFLRFDGIDTLSDVYLDGIHLGTTENMHRVYEFDNTDMIHREPDGEHHLCVLLHSPIHYIEEAYHKQPIEGIVEAMPGFPYLRKASCMFGWDWGPRLPDAGLFRPVSLVGYSCARIQQVLIRQNHHVIGKTVHGNEVDYVKLMADVRIEWMPEAGSEDVEAELVLTDPEGARHEVVSAPVHVGSDTTLSENLTGLPKALQTNHIRLEMLIKDPRRWWPNGYGEQPLYLAQVILKKAGESDACLDTWEKRIGLRTVTVNTDPIVDETLDSHLKGQKPDYDDGICAMIPDGDTAVLRVERDGKKVSPRNFAIEVNGLQIFAMGADYIPEDNILTRQNRKRSEMLLSSAQEAHYNCIRVWGGGYYCDDYLYDLCDEKGILVWQDLMFACAAYELDEAFEKNINAEIRQNIRRLRSHPCIGLWCGNNENETQYETWHRPRTKKQFYDYIRMFECLIPRMVEEEDPDAFFWPSSPSAGGNFENSCAENVGDTHYWDVWHGGEPFTAFRKHHFRFLSEFGFQSFPALQTIRRYTEPEDRNIFSRVMEMHQRNSAANGKILNYLSLTYLYPKNFDELVYCSQLLQAEAIRYGVEHFRRHRGMCMGTVVWQLDDIWPVASWSSVDYYGNWKALHYAEKRIFAPILISCEEHGEIDQKPFPNSLPVPVDVSADLHVANETGTEVTGTVKWSLRDPASKVLQEGQWEIHVPAYSGVWLPHLDFNGEDPLSVHLTYAFVIDGKTVSEGSSLFCAPKYYHFADPKLTVFRDGDEITVTSQAYAKSVEIETEAGVLRLDDNFVDMESGKKVFHVLPGRDFTDAGNCFRDDILRVRSVYETAER